MTKLKTSYRVVCCCVLVVLCSVAQAFSYEHYSDFQTWYGATVKLDLPDKWMFAAQYRMRMIDNTGYYYGAYLFADVSREFSKHFEANVNYRLAMVTPGVYHRYAFGFEGKTKLFDIETSFRPMIQYQVQNFAGNDEGVTDTDTYLRLRGSVKYDLTKHLDIYAYAEPFFKPGNQLHLDWWQNAVGVKYEFAKNKKINLYYLWQPDNSHTRYFQTNHILAAEFEWTIKL